jgi:hypothetical protein
MYFIVLSVIAVSRRSSAAGFMTREPARNRQHTEKSHPESPAGDPGIREHEPLRYADVMRPATPHLNDVVPSDQEKRHQDQNDDDGQQRDLDEPGKPDPGPAVPFQFWVNRCHRRLARKSQREI